MVPSQPTNKLTMAETDPNSPGSLVLRPRDIHAARCLHYKPVLSLHAWRTKLWLQESKSPAVVECRKSRREWLPTVTNQARKSSRMQAPNPLAKRCKHVRPKVITHASVTILLPMCSQRVQRLRNCQLWWLQRSPLPKHPKQTPNLPHRMQSKPTHQAKAFFPTMTFGPKNSLRQPIPIIPITTI